MMPSMVKRDSDMLKAAFDSFAEVSGSLERAFETLEDKVRSLSNELEETNAYLESILSSLPCGVLVVNADEVVTRTNPQAIALLEAGDSFLPLSLAAMVAPCGADIELLRGFRNGTTPGEIRLQQANRTLSCAWSNLNPSESVLVLQDVTELRTLEERMLKSERLAAMGEMALEVAHEIRNPLTGLGLYASLLRERDLKDGDRDRYLANIEIGIQSLDTILSNMLCFSGDIVLQRQTARLSALMDGVVDFMGPVIDERRIEVSRAYCDRDAAPVDTELVKQAFMNLVLNALQALPEKGRLRIETRNGERGVTLRIRDNGIGIPGAFHGRVFEPHFTTTEKGSGLGLGIVKKIVQAHGGSVELRSRRSEGTCFTLRFPLESKDR